MVDPRLGHVGANITGWQAQHEQQLEAGRRGWSANEPSWGIFSVPESQVGLLPDSLDGLDIVELGCGTGYVSAWLSRLGGRPVGLDPTPGQLGIASQLQEEFAVRFPLVRAAAEQTPFADNSFDLAVSEYGAAIWADPYAWIPEAARILRPGGELVFLGNSTLMILCAPDEDHQAADERLLRPQFGMHRVVWPGDPMVEFHMGHGDWIRLLRSSGFEVEDLIEIRPPEGASTGYEFVTLEWARRWPCEEVWKVRLRS